MYEWVLAYAPTITGIGALVCVALCILYCVTKKFGFFTAQFVVALLNLVLCYAALFVLVSQR